MEEIYRIKKGYEIRPIRQFFSQLLTSGMFVEGIDAMTGTTSFRVAYKVFEDDELIFIKSSSLEARVNMNIIHWLYECRITYDNPIECSKGPSPPSAQSV